MPNHTELTQFFSLLCFSCINSIDSESFRRNSQHEPINEWTMWTKKKKKKKMKNEKQSSNRKMKIQFYWIESFNRRQSS